MAHQCLLSSALIVCGIFVVAETSAAAGKKKMAEKPDPAVGTVERVLRAEVAGEVDRRAQLAATLEQHPDSMAARWQAGFVRDGKVWRSFDQAPQQTNSEASLNYLARRQEAPQTFAGQLNLANWCRSKGLSDQEHAHLFACGSLAGNQDITEIGVRYGCGKIAGVWLSPEELRAWQRVNQQTEASLNRWEAKLNAIGQGLAGTSNQRDAALTKLKQLNDPSAVAAIELTLAGQSEETALLAVETFRRFDGPQSSLALATQALFSNWPRVRTAASAALKGRSFDDFVPAMISLLSTPVRTELRYLGWSESSGYFSGSGVLLVSYVLARETASQFQVATFQTTNYLVNSYVDGMIVEGSLYRASRGNNAADLGMVRGQVDQVRRTRDQAEFQDRAIVDQNEISDAINRRIGEVLAGLTGRESTADARVWWQWWNQQSDLQEYGDKQVVIVSESEVLGNPMSGFRIYSCFAAGTPISTDQGLVAVEKITVGDRVLSQDVATGVLAFKPVLQTTIRPPKELVTLAIGDETVVCTGGHRFWNSGSGWVKARDIEPHTMLHTVTGNAPVWTAKKGRTAETYNLVVADFHTYFVGKSAILCQDLLPPAPTDCVVPGMSRANVVAPTKK